MANPRAGFEKKLQALYCFHHTSYPKLNEYRNLAAQHGRAGEIDKVKAMLISVEDVPYNMHINGVPDDKNKQELAFEFNVAILVSCLFGQSHSGKFDNDGLYERLIATVPEEYRKSVAESIISDSNCNDVWPKYTPANFHFEQDAPYIPPQESLRKHGFFSAKRTEEPSTDWIAATPCSYGN